MDRSNSKHQKQRVAVVVFDAVGVAVGVVWKYSGAVEVARGFESIRALPLPEVVHTLALQLLEVIRAILPLPLLEMVAYFV